MLRARGLLLIAGVILPLDHVAIQDALSIASSSIESTHRRFHADYQIPVNKAPIDFVSIVSPFRRLVLSAETARHLGGRTFGQREALAALQPDPRRFEVYVELSFHPHNTFIGVPEYAVALEPVSPPGSAIVPAAIDRLPRVGPRFDDARYPYPYPLSGAAGNTGRGEPLAGGTLIARLDGGELDPRGVYAVVVRDGTRELARAVVDLGKLR